MKQHPNPHLVVMDRCISYLGELISADKDSSHLDGGFEFTDEDHKLGSTSTKSMIEDTLESAYSYLWQALECDDLRHFLDSSEQSDIVEVGSNAASLHGMGAAEAIPELARVRDILSDAVVRMGPRVAVDDAGVISKWLTEAGETAKYVADDIYGWIKEPYGWCGDAIQWFLRAECCKLHDAMRPVLLPEGSRIIDGSDIAERCGSDIALDGTFLELSTGSVYSMFSERLVAPGEAALKSLVSDADHVLESEAQGKVKLGSSDSDSLGRSLKKRSANTAEQFRRWAEYLSDTVADPAGQWFMCKCDMAHPRRV